MRKTVLVLVLLSVFGLLAYSNSFSVPFQFDGPGQIADNPMIRSLDNFAPALEGRAPHPPPGSVYNNRRVVGYLTLALNYRLGGLNVKGYHVVNIAIHLINGFIVYLLVMLTLKTPYFRKDSAKSIEQRAPDKELDTLQGTGRPGESQESSGYFALSSTPYAFFDPRYLIALFSALLFVVHPVQTQAVTYIVQRFTSLAAMFYLLSIVFYIKGRIGQESRQAASFKQQATNSSEQSAISCQKEDQKACKPAGLHLADRNLKSTIDDEKSAGGQTGFLPQTSNLKPQTRRPWSIIWYLWSIFFAVCAMLTKEIAFTLPLMIVLYEFFFFKSTLKKKLLFLLPVLLTLAIIPVFVMGSHHPLGEVLSDLSARTRVETNIPRWDYLMTQMRVITTYVRLLFLPVNQDLDYDYPIYHSLSQPPVFLSSLFLLSLMGLAVYLIRKSRQADKLASNKQPAAGKGLLPPTSDLETVAPYYRLISFGILWFFIALSVESSVIPIADVIFEHRVYLPSVGAFMAVVAAVFVIAGKIGGGRRFERILVPVFSAIVIVLLSGATYARNAIWKDPVRLWQDVADKGPGNPRGYNNLGYLYLMKGQTDKSIEYFRSALRIKPNYSNAHTNLGVAYYDKGWTDAAIDQFRTALTLEPYGPDVAEDHHNLGIAFTRKGMLDEAIAEYRTALKLAPRDPGIYNDLGVAYRQKGLNDSAIECFRKALNIDPGYVYAHLNLAQAYEAEGRRDEARQHYAEARRLSSEKR